MSMCTRRAAATSWSIDELQPKGVGALELALRKLREKLAAEGLVRSGAKAEAAGVSAAAGVCHQPDRRGGSRFSAKCCGGAGAASMCSIIPARVQGDGAAQEIVAGIRLANRLSPRPDVLVVGRGGGSLEDLWAFNEEPVVRAIAASRIPTVSAVGHEIDVTLADLAADVRALTPSEAAERVVPAAEEISARMRALSAAAAACGASARDVAAGAVRWRRRPAAVSPAVRFGSRSQPAARRAGAARQCDRCGGLLRDRESRLATMAGKIESLSPLAVLARGYTITQDATTATVVRDASRLARRAIDCHAVCRRRGGQQSRID